MHKREDSSFNRALLTFGSITTGSLNLSFEPLEKGRRNTGVLELAGLVRRLNDGEADLEKRGNRRRSSQQVIWARPCQWWWPGKGVAMVAAALLNPDEVVGALQRRGRAMKGSVSTSAT